MQAIMQHFCTVEEQEAELKHTSHRKLAGTWLFSMTQGQSCEHPMCNYVYAHNVKDLLIMW